MKGIRLYLIALGLLLALSAYLLLSRRSGSYAPSKIDFSVDDTGGIEMVRISRQGESVELCRTDGSWKVNGDIAREDAIRGLSIGISRIEVEAPVSGTIKERIYTGLRDYSTEVLIAMKDGRDKSYRVYFDSVSGSSFMMGRDSDLAFRVGVRGYRQSNIAALYSCDSRYWRENIIFRLMPGEISAISVLHNAEPERSFHLLRNDAGEFEVAGGIIPGPWSVPGKEGITRYLEYFREVRFEAFRDPGKDSLYCREEPDYIISVEDKSGTRRRLELFPAYHRIEGEEKQLELNRIYGRIGSRNEWIVIKYVQIDPLLQEFEYFK